MERRDCYGRKGSLWKGGIAVERAPSAISCSSLEPLRILSLGGVSWAELSPLWQPGRGENSSSRGSALPDSLYTRPVPSYPRAVLGVQRQRRSRGCPGVTPCSALPLDQSQLPRTFTPFMFPLWCYFCSTFPLSSVLSCLSFVSWAASSPLFVPCRSLLCPCPLSLLYSLFSFVCSYSFVIPFDCLFPLRIFFFTLSGSFLFHLSSFFPSCFVFPLFLFSLLMVLFFVCVWIPHLPLSSLSSHFGWETSLRFFP